jgi:hypothetical protein
MNEKQKTKPLTFKEFFKHGRKPNAPTFTKMYWPIAQPLSYLLFRLGMSPNGVSLLNGFIALLAIPFFLNGNIIAATGLLLLSYIIDFCDGNIARVWIGHLGIPLVGKRLRLGLTLENFNANISYAVLFLGMGYYLFVSTGEVGYFFLATIAYVMKLISRYTVLHVTLLNKKPSASDVVCDEISKGSNALFDVQSRMHKIKYTLTSIIDNARVYFISYFLMALFAPQLIPILFKVYMLYVFVINFTKICLTLIRQQP